MKVSPAVYSLIVHPRFFTRWIGERYVKPYYELGGKKVLEFGCGPGANCIMFDPELYLGVDIDERRIEFARKSWPGYRFEVVGADLAGIAAGSRDVILVCAVLHHLTDRQILAAEKEFLRILRPGGALLVIEPYLAPGYGIINRIMQYLDEGRFIRTEDQYRTLLARFFAPRVLKRFRLPNLSSMLFLIASRSEERVLRSGPPPGRRRRVVHRLKRTGR
jgi:SAM-dependent methyltransferase